MPFVSPAPIPSLRSGSPLPSLRAYRNSVLLLVRLGVGCCGGIRMTRRGKPKPPDGLVHAATIPGLQLTKLSDLGRIIPNAHLPKVVVEEQYPAFSQRPFV